MSLLDNGPHTVELFIPKVVGRDRANNLKLEYDWDNPLVFRGVTVQNANVNSFGAAEDAQGPVDTRRILRTRAKWPGGAKSIIRWRNRLWDQDGEARHYEMGVGTRHSLVRLRARDSEVK